MSGHHASPSRPHPLGVTPRDGGADVAVVAAHAEAVELCLVETGPDGEWAERRFELTGRTHGIWHGFVPGMGEGTRYGFRVHGPWDPRRGHRHNPAKLLLDPYARAVVLPRRIAPEVFGHHVAHDLTGDPWMPDFRDSGPHAPHGVVTTLVDRRGPAADRPGVPWEDTVIYEAHPRGLTRHDARRARGAARHVRRPGARGGDRAPDRARRHDRRAAAGARLPQRAGAHPARAAELLGLQHARLLRAAPVVLGDGRHRPGRRPVRDPAAAVREFRAMVDTLHRAGLEVLLDVVYNHTCEGGSTARRCRCAGSTPPPTTGWTPTATTSTPPAAATASTTRDVHVARLVLDSLRYWVEQLHVDGFRFDPRDDARPPRRGLRPGPPAAGGVQ
jgi:glycogen operon protein